MTWKKALLVALVVLLVLIGLPMLMPGMGGAATCTDCPPAAQAQVCTLAAVLSTFALAIILLSQRVRQRGDHLRQLLLVPLLERPPQPA